MSDTVDERADTLLASGGGGGEPPIRQRFPETEITTGELHRGLGYAERKIEAVERRVEANSREINGAGGRDLGIRGALQSLDKRMKDLDEDLEANRREAVERNEALRLLMTTKFDALAAQVAARRMSPALMWFLVLLAVAFAVAFIGLQAYAVLVLGPN